jgi:hypothetical protein
MLLGANSLTQWYCPPALGDIEAISAIDATTCRGLESDVVHISSRGLMYAYGYGEDPCRKEHPNSALIQ